MRVSLNLRDKEQKCMGSIRRTPNKVDSRLVEHEERVAYIALKILEEAEGEMPDQKKLRQAVKDYLWNSGKKISSISAISAAFP